MMRVVMVLLLVGGCSIAYVRSPADVGAQKCTTSYTSPIVDTVVALAGAAAIVVGVANGAPRRCGIDAHGSCHETTLMSFGIVFGVPYAASAAVGYTKVGRCETARYAQSGR